MKKARFENLDSLRTIAFFSTFLAHAFYTNSNEIRNSTAFEIANNFAQVFSFGVPIFFVLSGFLISYLMIKEQEITGFGIVNFFMRRVLRIWPVYYLVLLMGFIVFPYVRSHFLGSPYIETASPIYYVTFLSNFDQISAGQLPFGVGLGPTWSVSVEEQFYLFWPMLLLIFPKKRFIIAIAISFIASIICTIEYYLPAKHTLYCVMYLSIGGLFGYLQYYQKGLIQKITKINSWSFLALVITVFSLMWVYIHIFRSFLLVIAISFLLGYIISIQSNSPSFKLSKIPFLERVGKYTYGLYLYHVICNFLVISTFERVFHIEDTVWNVILIKPIFSLILSILISVVSYRYFELYFLRKKNHFRPTKKELNSV